MGHKHNGLITGCCEHHVVSVALRILPILRVREFLRRKPSRFASVGHRKSRRSTGLQHARETVAVVLQRAPDVLLLGSNPVSRGQLELILRGRFQRLLGEEGKYLHRVGFRFAGRYFGVVSGVDLLEVEEEVRQEIGFGRRFQIRFQQSSESRRFQQDDFATRRFCLLNSRNNISLNRSRIIETEHNYEIAILSISDSVLGRFDYDRVTG